MSVPVQNAPPASQRSLLRRQGRDFCEISAAVFLVATLVACQRPAAPPPSEPVKAQPASERPASRWVYHPLEKSPVTARVGLGGGRELEVDSAGSRWLRQSGESPTASAFGAPEALVALLVLDKQFASLGQSGAVYLADEALGPFVETRTPPELLSSASAVAKTLAAVNSEGAIVRSTDLGRTWQVARHDAFFAGVAAHGKGELLAYTVPETWYHSTDLGQSFRRLPVSSIAPRKLVTDLRGQVRAQGLYHHFLFQDGRLKETQPEEKTLSDYSLSPHARASVIDEGHAILVGDEYIALSRDADSWNLSRGEIGSALVDSLIPGPEKCEEYRMSARGKKVALICQRAREAGVAPRLTLHRSDDAGASFEEMDQPLRGKLERVHLALRADGQLSLTGVCPLAMSELGCQPRGLITFSSDLEKDPSTRDLPQLSVPSDIVYDEGGRLWAGGIRGKDSHFIAFGPLGDSTSLPALHDLTQLTNTVGEPQPGLRLLPGKEGELAIAFSVGSARHTALFSPEGYFLGAGRVPDGSQEVSGAGRRLAALATKNGSFYESLTGGMSWQRMELPRSLCSQNEKECELPLACSDSGCVIGDELSRVGWSRQSPQSRAELPLEKQNTFKQKSAQGYRCTPAEGTWRELPGLMSVPDANDAALGKTMWAQVQSFPDQGSAVAIHAKPGSVELEKHVLMAPVQDPEKYAFHVSPQFEGAAALRYRIPSRRGGGSQTTIEVAWDNRIEDLLAHAQLRGVTDRRPTNHSSRSSRTKEARPALISVAGSGLYVKLREVSGPSGETHFFEGHAPSTPARLYRDPQWPHEAIRPEGWFSSSGISNTARAERVRVFGQDAPLLMIGGSRVLVRASPLGEGHEFTPYLMGLLGDESTDYVQGVRLSYRGKNVGFVSLQVEAEGKAWRAQFVQLAKDGTFDDPISVPLQADIRGLPRSCTEEQLNNSPRIVAPSFPGPVRQIRVLGLSSEPLLFESGAAVLFGNPKAPCMAALEAREKENVEQTLRYSVLLAPEPGQHSWIFRAERLALGARMISARPMLCSAEP